MQTIIQVLPKRTGSLREKIIKDARLQKFDLFVTKEKTMDRSKGWFRAKAGKGTRCSQDRMARSFSDAHLPH